MKYNIQIDKSDSVVEVGITYTNGQSSTLLRSKNIKELRIFIDGSISFGSTKNIRSIKQLNALPEFKGKIKLTEELVDGHLQYTPYLRRTFLKVPYWQSFLGMSPDKQQYEDITFDNIDDAIDFMKQQIDGEK